MTSKPDFKVMVLLLVFMQLTRDLFAIAKFLLSQISKRSMKITDICYPHEAKNRAFVAQICHIIITRVYPHGKKKRKRIKQPFSTFCKVLKFIRSAGPTYRTIFATCVKRITEQM